MSFYTPPAIIIPKSSDDRTCGSCFHTRFVHSKTARAARHCYAGLCDCAGWVGEDLARNHYPKIPRASKVKSSDDEGRGYMTDSPCSLDGIMLSEHVRCPGCRMLYGEGHDAAPVDAQNCQFCISDQAKRDRKKGVWYSTVKP